VQQRAVDMVEPAVARQDIADNRWLEGMFVHTVVAILVVEHMLGQSILAGIAVGIVHNPEDYSRHIQGAAGGLALACNQVFVHSAEGRSQEAGDT